MAGFFLLALKMTKLSLVIIPLSGMTKCLSGEPAFALTGYGGLIFSSKNRGRASRDSLFLGKY